MNNITVEKIKESINWLINEHEGCCHYYLDTIDNNNYAIVIGWEDGYDEDSDDPCAYGTYRIAAKVAYQPSNSIMQCDYEIDWTMPYDEETNEVYDTSVVLSLDDNYLEGTLSWLKKEAKIIIENKRGEKYV